MIEMNLAERARYTSRYITIVVDDVHVVLSFSFNIYGYEHGPRLPSVPLRSGSPHDVINICLVSALCDRFLHVTPIFIYTTTVVDALLSDR